MSYALNPKAYIAPYEMLTPWDEVLLGDEELFKEMAEPYVPALLAAARQQVNREIAVGNLQPGILQPEELVGETLVQAWASRHGRREPTPVNQWLLGVQEDTLQKLMDKERQVHEPIALSLEEPVSPDPPENDYDDNEFWQRVEPIEGDYWMDVIPDESRQDQDVDVQEP